jgi:hypothetical protein
MSGLERDQLITIAGDLVGRFLRRADAEKMPGDGA